MQSASEVNKLGEVGGGMGNGAMIGADGGGAVNRGRWRSGGGGGRMKRG